MLSTQQISSVVCVVLYKFKYIAISITILIILWKTSFANFLSRVNDVKLMYHISQFVFLKFNVNSLIVIVYGRDRCSPDQIIQSYLDYDIDDDNELKLNLIRFTCFLLFFVVAEYFCIYINTRQINFLKILHFFLNQHSEQSDRGISHIPISMTHPESIDNNNENKIMTKTMIAWTDLSLSKPITCSPLHSLSSKSFTIFNRINGSFAVQSLNALMGPSGAGKTTLLKCLNHKYNKYLAEDSKIFIKFTDVYRNVFIKQDISEHLLKGLTVGQTLLYASKLKNSRSDDNLDHNTIVSQILSDLLISDTIDNRVESCSGGEQKRIAIACELTAQKKPNILYIDEPTSGLDSMTAYLV